MASVEEDLAVASLEAARATIAKLREELAEYEALFELSHKADMRAIKMWHDKGGDPKVWPDKAKMVVWLLEQLDEAEKKIAATGEKGGEAASLFDGDALARLRQVAESVLAGTPKRFFYMVVHKRPDVIIPRQYRLETADGPPTPERLNNLIFACGGMVDPYCEPRGDKLIIQEVSEEFWYAASNFAWLRE